MALTEKHIQALYQKYHVPHNVIQHMIKVAEFAKKIAKKLIKKGYKIDIDLIEQAALVHDILRVCDFHELALSKIKQPITSKDLTTWLALREKYGKIGHSKAAANVLTNIGEPALANLVLKHAIYQVENLKTLEEKVLYYADKRVQNDRVVSLRKRFKAFRIRNKTSEKKVYELEKEIKFACKTQA